MAYPVPVIDFENLAGTGEPKFATFRLGKTWARMVHEGQRVFVKHKHLVVFPAWVIKAQHGPAEYMLKELAHCSHLELALAKEQGASYDASLAPQRRFESLTKLYGPHRFNAGSTLSVLVLKPKR